MNDFLKTGNIYISLVKHLLLFIPGLTKNSWGILAGK